MRKTVFAFLIAISILGLAGCNLPVQNASPTPDIIATQVSVMLTDQPDRTPQSTQAA